MCCGWGARSVGGMTITRIRITLAAAVALMCAAALLPAVGHAAGRTKTLKVFSKAASITVTAPDGTVVDRDPQPGDVLDVFSVDFRGTHKHHAKRPMGSEHLQCIFGTGEPDCTSHIALRGGSLLVFRADRLIAGTLRYRGATGHVISVKEVPGGTDAVAKIKLRRR